VHEASLAEELVNKCATLAQGRPVLVVAVRCPPGMGSSELSDSFAILAASRATTAFVRPGSGSKRYPRS
jgi:hypothetical protein